MTLKELRQSYSISQKEAALVIGMPLRTYIRYEKMSDVTNLKYLKAIDLLKEKYEINENKGILDLTQIKQIVNDVLKKYKENVNFCYLFGSYAKGYAREDSDVDLCIDTTLTGLKYVGLLEELHQELKKNVDLVRTQELNNNIDLTKEILMDGIKLYG